MIEAPGENELQPGQQVLSRYGVLGKLTQGGMAEVYLANQRGPAGYSKMVVIKRVRPHLASDKDFVAMFVNEARLAALINHPNVVSIFDLGQDGNDWLLAMEYLDGRDMLQVGRACRQHNKAVPFDVTARIIADACAGLEHAHNLHGQDGKALNLVHRDMSPENILITFEGAVKVVDFGIAKARDNAVRTQAGQIKGKLGYVAPEAILGKALDARADIFAIGATLYLFLCGRPAFTGNNPMEIFEKSLKPPTAPRDINKRVPQALADICMRCLAQDREERFRTCGELRQALEAHLGASGRPLGPAQLAQFMKILFPAQSDPMRQRINQLIAHGNALLAKNDQLAQNDQLIVGPATAPTTDALLFDGDKTQAAVANPTMQQDQGAVESDASILPRDAERTAVALPPTTASAGPTADGAPIATAAPASVEFTQESAQKTERNQNFGHLRSVELGDEIEADRKRAAADRRGRKARAREEKKAQAAPSALPPIPPPGTIEVDDGMDIDVDLDLDVEATMVNRELPSLDLPSIEISADLDLPPPPIDDAATRPPVDNLGGLTLDDPALDDPALGAPPAAPLTSDDMMLPAVALQANAPPGFEQPLVTEPYGDQHRESLVAGSTIVHVKPALVARMGMFVLGAIFGCVLLAAGLYALGDLSILLAHAGIDLPSS